MSPVDVRPELERVRDPRLRLPDRRRKAWWEKLLEAPIREAKRFEERVLARTQIDLDGLAAGIKARLAARLPLSSLAVAPDLEVGTAAFGLWSVRTSLWDAPRLRKIALSQVRVLPMVEGVALVLAPSPELEFPVLACDLMALPARLSLNLELYGAPALRPLCMNILAPHEAALAQLRNRAQPEWTGVIASGYGVHARIDPRRIEACSGAISGVLGAYLEALERAQPGPLGVPSQRTFFSMFHQHGPRRGPLSRVLGKPWAERYSRLMFE